MQQVPQTEYTMVQAEVPQAEMLQAEVPQAEVPQAAVPQAEHTSAWQELEHRLASRFPGVNFKDCCMLALTQQR